MVKSNQSRRRQRPSTTKVVTTVLKKKQPRNRPARNRTSFVRNPLSHRAAAARLIADYCTGHSSGDYAEAPCSKPHQFTESSPTWTYEPVWDVNGAATVLINPHMLWCDTITGVYSTDPATGVSTTQRWAAVQQTDLAAADLSLPTTTVGAIPNCGVAWDVFPSSQTQYYKGNVRMLHAALEIDSFQSFNNTGGRVWISHNSASQSPLYHDLGVSGGLFTDVVQGAPLTSYQSLERSSLDNLRDGCITHCILPPNHCSEFEPCSTATFDVVHTSIAALAETYAADSNHQLSDLIPDSSGEFCPHGWTTVVRILPFPGQTVTQGTSTGLVLRVTGHYHLDVKRYSATNTTPFDNNALTAAKNVAIADPTAASAISTAISAIAKARLNDSSSNTVSQVKSQQPGFFQSVLNSFAKFAPDIAQMAANFLPGPAGMIARGLGSIARPILSSLIGNQGRRPQQQRITSGNNPFNVRMLTNGYAAAAA